MNMEAAMGVGVNMAAKGDSDTGKDSKEAKKDLSAAYMAKKQRDEDKNNPVLKRYMKREDKRQEQRIFQLKSMLIRSNLVLSTIFITSIHSPRHVRWTLTIATVSLLWFCIAVVYNNTKDPL
jgi:hypothetical protein